MASCGPQTQRCIGVPVYLGPLDSMPKVMRNKTIVFFKPYVQCIIGVLFGSVVKFNCDILQIIKTTTSKKNHLICCVLFSLSAHLLNSCQSCVFEIIYQCATK